MDVVYDSLNIATEQYRTSIDFRSLWYYVLSFKENNGIRSNSRLKLYTENTLLFSNNFCIRNYWIRELVHSAFIRYQIT